MKIELAIDGVNTTTHTCVVMSAKSISMNVSNAGVITHVNRELRENTMKVGSAIKLFRKAKKITRSTLASNIRVSVGRIRAIESGKHQLQVDTLETIAAYLEIPPAFLLLPPKWVEGYGGPEMLEDLKYFHHCSIEEMKSSPGRYYLRVNSRIDIGWEYVKRMKLALCNLLCLLGQSRHPEE